MIIEKLSGDTSEEYPSSTKTVIVAMMVAGDSSATTNGPPESSDAASSGDDDFSLVDAAGLTMPGSASASCDEGEGGGGGGCRRCLHEDSNHGVFANGDAAAGMGEDEDHDDDDEDEDDDHDDHDDDYDDDGPSTPFTSDAGSTVDGHRCSPPTVERIAPREDSAVFWAETIAIALLVP
jgi:hypothetical protein